MKLPNKKLILAGIAISLLFFGQKVGAQNVRVFTIVPPSIETNLNPGQTTEGTMKVINDSENTLYFNVNVKDFVVNDANGTPNLLPNNSLSNKYSAASWIGVTPSYFAVPPHQKQILNYFIQIPNNAGAGGHYAAITYEPAGQGALQGSGASVNTVLGTLFYVGVNGNINQSASITKFLANGFQEYGPVNIFTQIQNNGDLHIKPLGAINVFDILGRKVQTQGLAERNIFPGGVVRDYQNKIGSKFMIGRYKATLLASYGKDDNLPLSASVYFWVFPWKITLLIVLVIVALILGRLYMKKKSQKSKDQETKVNTPPEAPQEPKTTA